MPPTNPPTPPPPNSPEAIRAWMAETDLSDLPALAAAILAGEPLGGPGTGVGRPTRPRAAYRLPKARKEVRILTVRVDLDGARPATWRRLEIRSDLTALLLHEVLQAAMGWADSHLHRFWVGPAKEVWRGPHLFNDLDESGWDEDRADAVGHEAEVVVDQLLRKTGDRLFYSYDFGDGWDHTIRVESIRPAEGSEPLAICLTGRRACPLENCGGLSGHEEIVEALAAGRPLPEPLEEWVPEDYDPTYFDVEETNLALSFLGADPAELMAMLQEATGIPTPHAAAVSLASRLSGDGLEEFSRLSSEALATDGRFPDNDAPTEMGEALTRLGDEAGPRVLEGLELRTAVRPWQLLLSTAGTDGIPLTAAGWMKPAVVSELSSELHLDRTWIGAATREDSTWPIAELREHAVRAKLLRKHKGHLVRTPKGRAVDGDPEALWLALAESLLAGQAGSSELDAAVVVLAHVAAGWPSGDRTFADAAELLGRAGWSTTVGALTPADVKDVVDDALVALSWIGGSWSLSAPAATVAQRALARCALFPGS